MKGTLVFDHLNDIVYLNCCSKFVDHVAKLAATQGLFASEHSTPHGRGKTIDPNILVQLFSPLVTSQRFMREQFGNPYTSVQCSDGTNIVFEDYMGFLFLRIGTEDITYLRRALGVCTSFVTYICGPDVSMLKASHYHAELLDHLLTTWTSLYSSDQSFMIEAVEQMIINPQLNSSLIKSLQQISHKIQSQVGDHVHALLFLETKLLSWFSTKGSFHLTPEDLLFLMLLCQKTWRRQTLSDSCSDDAHKATNQRKYSRHTSNSSTDTDCSEIGGKTNSTASKSGFLSSHEDEDGSGNSENKKYDMDGDGAEEAEEAIEEGRCLPSLDEIFHYLVLFKSDRVSFVPQIIHCGMVQDGLFLVLVCEPPTSSITTSLCTALQVAVEFHGSRRETLRDKQYYELLESSCKKIIDLLKKQKNIHIRNELQSRWDRFKIGFQQYLKTKDAISIQLNPVIDILVEGFRKYFNEKILSATHTNTESSGIFGYRMLSSKSCTPLDDVWMKIKSDTEDFWEFLKVKANRNVTIGAKDTLTINKYLEEFPGLVHFVYIDRNKHMVTMPALDYTREDSVKLTKRKIWAMVKFARDHMQQGHFSIMWKDSAFNYAYFLWFEDVTGQSVRPKQPPALPWDGYPLPGIMCGDFYKRLMQECFPGVHPSKIRCLELFCIHLGLATSSCVLEHSKRLATTICDLTGNNPTADLL